MEIFERIILVGSTRLLYQCADIVKEKYFPLEPEVIDLKPGYRYESYKQNYNYRYMKKSPLMDFIYGIQEKTLIISVMNFYLFPSRVVEKKNLTCINLHHALLPNRPGRNAEAWAIWEMDTGGGITWHYIFTEIDAGDILAQTMIPIEEDETSLSLFRKEGVAALKALRSILPLNSRHEQICIKQDTSKRGRLRYSWEAPNDGFLDLDWDGKTIYRFLRAMNYGVPDFFMYMKVKWNGTTYRFFKYKKADVSFDDNGICFDDASQMITIQKDGMEIKLLGLEKID